jgi:hypothetical protein
MSKLNPFILVVIDNQLNPDKYTHKQLEDNADEANDAARAAARAAADADAAAERWVNSYFGLTGENKQDYIEALKSLRK